jgi:hypothetical protein
MPADLFIESVWRRGWRDTKLIWTSWQFVIFIFFTQGVVFLLWFLGFTTIYMSPAAQFASMLFFWIFSTVGAAVVQRNEARKRVQELENERVARLAVKPCTGRRQSDSPHEHLMWAELQVTNTSSSQRLEEVEVRVIRCLNIEEKPDKPNVYLLFDSHDWNPSGIYWSERDANPTQLRLTIAPSATRSSLIAFQDDPNGGACTFNTRTHSVRIGSCKIDMEVSSLNSAPWLGAFYIQCHPNYVGGSKAKFEFVEWDTWVANHNVEAC